MNLRPASPEDATILSSIHDANFEDRWDAAFFSEMLGQSGVYGFIAGEDDGFILIRSVAGEAEILTIAVRACARRAGLGRLLVQKGAEISAQTGAETLFLEVSVKNTPAKALYESLGFTTAGIRKRYYQTRKNGMEDALVLRVALPLGKAAQTHGNETGKMEQ